jgi:hypothetical protein
MHRRTSSKIASGEATIVACITFAMGALLGSGLGSGGEFPFKCFERGNFADWLAGVGTWVIGYGAWKYAKQSHDRSVAEINAIKSARLNLAASRAVKMTLPLSSVEEIYAIEDNRRTFRRVKLGLAVIRDCIGDLAWSDGEMAAFDADLVHKAGAASMALSFLRTELGEFIELHEVAAKPTTLIPISHLRAIRAEAERLAGVGEEMLELLLRAQSNID